jgi:hypothetical protein
MKDEKMERKTGMNQESKDDLADASTFRQLSKRRNVPHRDSFMFSQLRKDETMTD